MTTASPRVLAVDDDRTVLTALLGGLSRAGFDVVVATEQMAALEPLFAQGYRVERFPHSLNVSRTGSDLRIQIQTDARYAPFVHRASARDVLGMRLTVAALDDVLQGKIWAAEDPSRRGSKRQKDLADIARILESFPQLRERVPANLLARLA